MSNFKSIMNKLNALSLKFADETEVVAVAKTEDAEEVVTKFEELPLMDESIIAFDGELAIGTAVFIVTEEGEQVPATEGTLQLGGELEGVSIVLDAEGIVLELIDERTEGEETPEEDVEEEMSSEKVESIVDNKMSDIETPLNAIVNGIESILSRNAELQSEINELKESFTAFKNEPTEEKEESRISTASNVDKRTKFYMNKLKK